MKTPDDVAQVIATYPPAIQKKIKALRQLILKVASQNKDVGDIEETLKWGEPSYLSKHGSTIRIAWKKPQTDSQLNQFAMYFNCNTKLIASFREIYQHDFQFEGNRAIVFDVKDELDIAAISHCIALALNYHRLKHLPLLGV